MTVVIESKGLNELFVNGKWHTRLLDSMTGRDSFHPIYDLHVKPPASPTKEGCYSTSYLNIAFDLNLTCKFTEIHLVFFFARLF